MVLIVLSEPLSDPAVFVPEPALSSSRFTLTVTCAFEKSAIILSNVSEPDVLDLISVADNFRVKCPGRYISLI